MARRFAQFQSLLKNIFQPTPTMPPPLLTFDGINSAQSLCGCFPPDTNGDVGPNHYVEAINVAFKVFDKNGNTLVGPDHVQFILFHAAQYALRQRKQRRPICFL